MYSKHNTDVKLQTRTVKLPNTHNTTNLLQPHIENDQLQIFRKKAKQNKQTKNQKNKLNKK
jgi:hypothetical protein